MLENHAGRNGEYQWNEDSGVYQEVGEASEPQQLYRSVRYDAGPVWAIGSEGSTGLFSTDIATCPEYIRDNWKYWARSE